MLGGTCLKKMQELAEVARDNKLGGTLILCPYYFRPESVKELVAFCKKVADVASGLLCYYDHIPYG
jgi:N-acetylneuraminate lyase